MKKHTRIYLDYFGISPGEPIHCEICGREAHDIHHISARGMGGSDSKDNIENLIALCRECHDKAEAEIYPEEYYREIHLNHMKLFGC